MVSPEILPMSKSALDISARIRLEQGAKWMLRRIDTKIRKHDNADTRKKKELLIKELKWCNEHSRDLTNTANVLYAKYISAEKFSARKQCLDFNFRLNKM